MSLIFAEKEFNKEQQSKEEKEKNLRLSI